MASSSSSDPSSPVPATRPETITNFRNNPVSLETDTEHHQVTREALLRAWVELQPHSVEVLLANQSDLLNFGNNHCLFFAAILWNHTSSPNYYPWAPDGEDVQSPTVRVVDTVGVIYIAPSTMPGQAHIGVAILPPFRNKGIARQACELACGWVIDTMGMHRIQARIVPSPHEHRVRNLFAALGFSHEGVHRRAVQGATGEWTDVGHMGVLDTTWQLRARICANPKSLWDELLERHQRELDEMLHFEERVSRLKRSSSMETVRVAREPNPVPEWEREGRVCTPSPPSEVSSQPSSRESSPGPSRPHAYRDSEGYSSDEDAPTVPFARTAPRSVDADDEDAPLLDAPMTTPWDELHASDPPRSPSEAVPQSPSSTSNSSFSSVGSSFGDSPERHTMDEDDWVNLSDA